MGLGIDVRDNTIEAKMEASTCKANGIFAQELEDELMKYTKKYEDYKVETPLVQQTEQLQRDANVVEHIEEVPSNTDVVDQIEEVQRNTDVVDQIEEVQRNIDDVEVNILECTKSLGNEVVSAEYQDRTESSSSFDGSDCGVDNFDMLGDSEALSDFRAGAASVMDFDGFDEKFRMRKKKKVTTHWRSFIQPLMWRCRWTELQIKKLQSQAQQYDRELEAYNKGKQIQLDNSTPTDGVKSLPFSQINPRGGVLKRKKRKRVEATSDVTAYISHHNLFSYYENRKAFNDLAVVINEPKNPGRVNNDDESIANEELLAFLESDDENSPERILYKIEYLQSRVRDMKSRVDRINRENAGKFSSFDDLSLAMLASASPPSASQLESASTSHGDVVLEANTSADAYENVEDGALIDNQRVKEEMMDSIERPLVINDVSVNTTATPPVMAEPEPPTDDQPAPKVRSIANLTQPLSSNPPRSRKRGRRRGAGGRGRRSTGQSS